ncbi:MAG: imidazoleglycerol-phosphate dehydratase HisB [Actinobacteria bacterium]|nr:imidazoleglycerol-phosphate dehydratase HisB [Actinomycetota bacterium]
MQAPRTATVTRATNETDISVTLDLDGAGTFEGSTGVGFLDHMLAQVAKHGLFDLRVKATGDLHIDAHHTAEDVAIVVGQAFSRALGDRAGIVRMGDATVPMDEALALVAVDLAGRDHASVGGAFRQTRIGDLPTSLIPHIIASLARHLGGAVHVRLLAGEDDHHKAEAIFKALGRALLAATRMDPRRAGDVPSTKGTLTR